ncbi:MAG TPA: LysR family transcriptional regulator [Gammaproteobacteria bacterium]|nr:LysR family transcriptional regulator [Gammaproteobacteria bacterium]
MVRSARHYQHNRLAQLRAFCQAVKAGSISKAAEKLELAQPTVSLQIQALEQELGEILLERRGPRIAPTPAGLALYELATPLVQGMDTLPQALADKFGRLDSGEINIASGESTLLHLLPPYVRQFAEAYPGIHIRLHNVTGRSGLAMLRSDEADFAVGSLLEVPEDMVYKAMFNFEPMLITAVDHPLVKLTRPITLEDIAPYGLILPPQFLSTWRRVSEVFRKHELEYNVRLQVGGWEVIKRYVEEGLGISIVTSICLRQSYRLRAFPMRRYFPERSYGVVHRRGKFLTPQARRFIDSLERPASA